MLDTISALASSPLVDLAFKIAGAVGLVIGAMALRASNAAVRVARASDIANLKMKAMEGRATAERALVSLEATCRQVGTSWNEHVATYYPQMTFNKYQPDEIVRNAGVEREGIHLMRKLAEKFEHLDNLDQDGLEQNIREAQRTTAEIERLSLRLEGPPFNRY